MFNFKITRFLHEISTAPLLVFTLVSNVLLLVPSWYMLEVYDRVVMSRNVMTLLLLSLLALAMLAVMEWLNQVRQTLLHQAGLRFVLARQEKVFDLSFYKGVKTNLPFNQTVVDQLNKVLQFHQSPALTALLDLPFALIFLVLIYAMSAVLGNIALLVALAVAALTYLNERAVHPHLKQANTGVVQSQSVLNNIVRNAEVVRAMDMSGALEQRWKNQHYDYLSHQSQASLAATFYQASSKLLQQGLGSAMLGVGCLLLLTNQFTAGGAGLIVGSILATRFVTPLVQLITNWKSFSNAQDAYEQLQKLDDDFSTERSAVVLPDPVGHLSVENASVKVGNTDRYIVRGVSFNLRAGQSIAIIGPSGAGKTTLARLVAGALSADVGSIRLDGAPLFDWDKLQVGRFIGYMPQDIDLQDGTIAQNIARFDSALNQGKVMDAVNMVGLASFIHGLEDGIETVVGAEGVALPGGKRQLIGLARALYDSPKLVVLDEPNSNLDQDGQLALVAALQQVKAAGSTVVIVTHHKPFLALVDFILVLVGGELRMLGPAAEILNQLQPASQVAQSSAEKISS